MDDGLDPMAAMEEEMRKKEERQQRELNLAIGLTDYLEGRDLTGKGKDVNQSGKQVSCFNC